MVLPFILLFPVTYIFRNSTLNFIFGFIIFYLFFIDYLLTSTILLDISTLITFLTKLNSHLVNPLIFLIILSLVSVYLGINCYWIKISLVMYIFILPQFLCLAQLNSTYLYVNPLIFATTLTNGLLIIHPLILYFYYASLWLYLSRLVLITNTYSLPWLSWYPFFKSKHSLYILGLIAIFLGSWWSYQELNWGGFWSWDLVEIFLLIVIIFSVAIQHKVNLGCYHIFKIIFILLNFSLYILSVRFNLINSIHNFISQTAFLYKHTYLLSTWLIVFFWFIQNWFFFQTRFIMNTSYSFINIFFSVVYYILILYVLFSYLLYYIFYISSSMIINAVPVIIFTFIIAALAININISSFIVPFSESILIGNLLRGPFIISYITLIHIFVFFFFTKVIVLYNIIILLSLELVNITLLSNSITNITLINQVLVNYSNLDICNTVSFLNLFIDNYMNSILGNNNYCYSMVIYAIPIMESALSIIIFAHKEFAKLSFVEDYLILIILLILYSLKYVFAKIKLDY